MRLVASFLFLVACSAPPRASIGGECEINSACDAPLVCRLGYCRTECATSADCAAGLACLLDPDGLGACQLPDETSCTLASECAAGLVCRFHECTNACETSRDCPGGARCETDTEGRACVDRSERGCTFDAECDPATTRERCISGRCRVECFTDRDCRNDFRCTGGACSPASFDGGDLDGGAPRDTANDVAFDGGPSACGGGPLTNAVALALEGQHSCAIVNEGGVPRVYCWGREGSFTGGSIEARCAAPVTALDGFGASSVAVTGNATCVRNDVGEVRCFGFNFDGVLGRGPTGPVEDATPVAIAGLTADAIAGGAVSFCALTGTSIACWGYNADGQLGDGTLMSRSVPTPAMYAGTELALGHYHGCAMGLAGYPICWGRNTLGQLGTGLDTALLGALSIASNHEHTCVVDATSVVQCWGANASGQLGRGMISVSEAMPAPVMGLASGVSAISLGYDHTCALLGTDGYCWGGPSVFAEGTPSLTPRLVFTGIRAIASGMTHACAITSDAEARVVCVGQNSSGELGDGTNDDRAAPSPVTVL